MASPLIIVRGGGDIASGTIHRLHSAGFRVLILETNMPLTIRRTVAFAEAVHVGSHAVEGVTARLTASRQNLESIWQAGEVPLLVDREGTSISKLAPFAVVDAILAKKNLGTHREMAPLTIGLGPGFVAGSDVHLVIETARGHDLGRIIRTGSAAADTGIPATVEGYARERVLYARRSGTLTVVCDIDSLVEPGQTVAIIDGLPHQAAIGGLVRGMIRSGTHVAAEQKIGDIDPRGNRFGSCHTISDKARTISGAVLEAIVAACRLPTQ